MWSKQKEQQRSKLVPQIPHMRTPSPLPPVQNYRPRSILSENTSKVNSEPCLEPSNLVLFDADEARKKRVQCEIQAALEEILARVRAAIDSYEGPYFNTRALQDPAYLYELLGDVYVKTQHQHFEELIIFLVGYEEKCENRYNLLTSVHDFFLKVAAGGTGKLLDKIEEDMVNFDSSTSGLCSALETAQNAAQKLVSIKQEMSKLITIVAMCPDTKKETINMQATQSKAKDEVATLSATLKEVQGNLARTNRQLSLLQEQALTHHQESSNLRRQRIDLVKLLQAGKDKLENDLKASQTNIEQLKEELELKSKPLVSSKMVAQTTLLSTADRETIKQLQGQILHLRRSYQSLVIEKIKLAAKHRQEMNTLREEFDADMAETRASYVRQLRTLMIMNHLYEDEEGASDVAVGKGVDVFTPHKVRWLL